MSARAGATILMLFPGDTDPTPIPRDRVAEAQARGAKFQRKPLALSILDKAGDVGGIAGQIGGGALGAPALALGPAGALVPPTMSVAGAGLGGAAGQGIREAGYRMLGYGDAPGTIGGESERQAKGAVFGEMLGPIAGAIARPFVAHGMGNPKALPGEPNPVTTNINEVRAPTGKILGRPGSAKATAARQASSNNLKKHMGELAAGGNTVDGTAAIDRAYQKMSAEAAGDATGAAQGQLDNLYNETIARHGKDLDPRMALTLRQRWDRASAPIINAIKRAKSGGPLPDPSVQMTAQWDKAIADEMRSEIENTSGRAAGLSPEASAARGINKVTSRRIGVEQAIKKTEAAKRGVNPIVTGMGGAAAGAATGVGTHSIAGGTAAGLSGAVLAHLLSQPEVTSRIGLGLTDPYVQMLLRSTPRFAIPRQGGQ